MNCIESIHSGSSTSHQYDVNGFTGPIDVLTQDEAKHALNEVCTELLVDPDTQIRKTDRNNGRFKLHLILPTIDSIAHHPLVIEAVQNALQTCDLCLWSSDINWKDPNSDGFFAPHQDSTYAGLSPPSKCLTAWIALSDPVGETEGCLSFYPQSHIRGQLPHEQALGGGSIQRSKDDNININNNMLSLGQYIAPSQLEKLDPPTPVAVPLRAGQMTLHSFYTVHASGPNRSSLGPRVGLALRYFDASTVVQTKTNSKEMVTWISSSLDPLGTGNRVSGNIIHNFDLEPRLPPHPTVEDIGRMRKIRDEALRREEANYFG
ncbi:phytanoyl-CoA dioxygenase family protein [Nitzschia inconspicua]|uniref:Phytanoyl-CoA dioxygenase family protein n=1 Tax=Nitzschia inconspicua TaxID=303405 RepID=A0A9K3PCB7_9STRA|nr:phytanoyl-CoA dioxygenase family protein [Nitzschia inconspicua]